MPWSEHHNPEIPLQPCPFGCSDEFNEKMYEPVIVETDDDRGNSEYFVHCPWCCCRGPLTGGVVDAAMYWNRE